jgi:hypothetical protein
MKMKSIQVGFKSVNILDDGTIYITSPGCNDEASVCYDENGDEYVRVDGQKVYLNQ